MVSGVHEVRELCRRIVQGPGTAEEKVTRLNLLWVSCDGCSWQIRQLIELAIKHVNLYA